MEYRFHRLQTWGPRNSLLCSSHDVIVDPLSFFMKDWSLLFTFGNSITDGTRSGEALEGEKQGTVDDGSGAMTYIRLTIGDLGLVNICAMMTATIITWANSITFPVSLSSAAMPTSRNTPRPFRRAMSYEPSWITKAVGWWHAVVGRDSAVLWTCSLPEYVPVRDWPVQRRVVVEWWCHGRYNKS